jgi:lysophospholipid acyltransferase (LPLAT)-like uncharacterized protein
MKIRNRFVIRTIARVIAAALRLWFRTVRWEIVESVPGINAYNDTGAQRYLFCIWHDGIFGVIFARKVFHIRPIRGSSGRRGAGAIREMLAAAEDWHIAIATDGPRGPRRQVKDGIIYLASHSGRPIIPVAIAARREWRPRGKWTDMFVPVPFTRAGMLGAPPLHVPPGLRPDELGPWRERVQQAMEEVDATARRIAAGEESVDAVGAAPARRAA